MTQTKRITSTKRSRAIADDDCSRILDVFKHQLDVQSLCDDRQYCRAAVERNRMIRRLTFAPAAAR
jgi:hypothetical protein